MMALLGLGFLVGQSDFELIFGGYALAFSAFFMIWRSAKTEDLPFYVALALLVRFFLIFAFPQLSDDIYRFIWDGRLICHGHNPFNYLPDEIMAAGWAGSWLDQNLYAELNSPDHYTIYPPVAQVVFALGTWLFPQSVFWSTVVMKIVIFAFEAGTILILPRLLNHLKLPVKNVLLYALNPLVIIEITGNLHFEGVMIFFFMLGLFWLFTQRIYLSAVAMALAVASKLLPLLFLMFFIKRLGWKKAMAYFAVLGITLLVLFIPLVNGGFFDHFGESLDLYFRKFEFNASIYYVVRYVGYIISGFNLIKFTGPILASLTFLGILWVAIREKDLSGQSLMHKMLFAICLYLSFTPTVHPWYVLLPLALTLFTRFRFAVLWSGLITLTYINYTYDPFFENLWIVGIEYILVFSWVAIELWRPKYLSLKQES